MDKDVFIGSFQLDITGIHFGTRADAKWCDFVSQRLLIMSFGKSQLPHKFVKLFLRLVIVKDKLTDLCGN